MTLLLKYLVVRVCRHFYERNQTVRFAEPSHVDAGQYKCVGYGGRDETSHVIELIITGQY